MAVLPRTIAVGKKMIKDIERILYWTTIVVQLIFFISYGYSIYTNISNIVFLVIYSILFVFSVINFIYYLVTYNSDNKKAVGTVKRGFRVFKYLINGTMLGVNIFEMINYGTSDWNKILLVVSGVSLLAQIVLELVRLFVGRYIDLFTEAIGMDLAIIEKIAKVKEVKGNVFELIDAPLEKLANKLEGKDPNDDLTETQKYLNELALVEKEKARQAKIEKKMRIKQNSDEKAQKQKGEIKEHLSIIKNKLLKK